MNDNLSARSALLLSLYSPQTKNGFYSKIQKSTVCDMLKLYVIQISVFISKVLLEHNHIHSCMYCYGYFCTERPELSSL